MRKDEEDTENINLQKKTLSKKRNYSTCSGTTVTGQFCGDGSSCIQKCR